MLIISNPASGHKTGPQFIDNFVLPLLREHQVPFQLEATTAPGHAGELAKNYLETLGGGESAVILVSGGDGTIHEIVNALYAKLGSSQHQIPKWPKIQLVIVNSGTANALYYSIYPLVAPPGVLRLIQKTLPAADVEVASRLQSVAAYLGRGITRPLALGRNTIFKRDGAIKQSLLSIVVASTALHANLLHTSEELRATIPGVERYTEAAKRNLNKWSHATARLKSFSNGSPILLYDPTSNIFTECDPTELTINGPFAYFLSTLNVDRLESNFVITPLASKIKPESGTMDIVVIQPLRCPQISEDTPEDRQKFAQILMGSMGAARSASHTHIRYPKDSTSTESPSANAEGPIVVQYYRCAGWEWMPVSRLQAGFITILTPHVAE